MNLFFELIQVSLGNKDRFGHQITETEWANLYDEACRQSLVGPLLQGVERYYEQFETSKLPWCVYQWMYNALVIENQNKSQIVQITKFIGSLDGRTYCVLKGQGVAILYDNPYRRQCGDLDIWLQGDRREVIKYMSRFWVPKAVIYHHIDLGDVGGVKVEVHFTPSWMNNLFVNFKLQKWFSSMFCAESSNVVNICGIDVCAPSLSFNRIYVLIHIYRHLFNEGVGLRQLMDYYYILKQGFTEQEKIECVRLMNRFKVYRFAKSVMYIMKEVFGLENEFLLTEVDARRGAFLLNEVMIAGNFGCYDSRVKINRQGGPLHRGFRRLGHDFRLFFQYPNEVLWSPVWKLYHWFYRIKYN